MFTRSKTCFATGRIKCVWLTFCVHHALYILCVQKPNRNATGLLFRLDEMTLRVLKPASHYYYCSLDVPYIFALNWHLFASNP